MNTNEIISSVVSALSTVDAEGNVTAFDLDGLKEVIKGLQSVGKEARTADKDAKKAKKEADNAALAERGKAYYDSLNEGDEFAYVDASGNEWKAIKISTKSKTGSTAACQLLEPPAGSKSDKRYPKFHQVSVPEGFEVAVKADAEQVA